MRDLARRSHSREAEAQRRRTTAFNLRDRGAAEAQRARLRPKSINVSRKTKYSEIENPRPPPSSASRPTKRRRLEASKPSRLEALSDRLSHRHPSRYNVNEWKIYKEDSIKLLQPHYPHSTPHFQALTTLSLSLP